MNPLSSSALIAALMCAFGITTGTSIQQTKNVHQYWKSQKDHFYTTDVKEIGVTNIGMTGNHGYKYEAIPFSVLVNPLPGTVVLKRYWNPDVTDHFYTTDSHLPHTCGKEGLYNVLPEGYKHESDHDLGYCFCDPKDGTLPLLRYYHDGMKNHYYTTAEKNVVKKYGGWETSFAPILPRWNEKPLLHDSR